VTIENNCLCQQLTPLEQKTQLIQVEKEIIVIQGGHKH